MASSKGVDEEGDEIGLTGRRFPIVELDRCGFEMGPCPRGIVL